MNGFFVFLSLCALGAASAPVLGQRYAHRAVPWIGGLAALSLLTDAALTLRGGGWQVALWSIEPFGPLTLALDRLSAWFALAAGLVFLPVSVYSARYLVRYAAHYSLPAFVAVYYAVLASIGLTLVAADVLSFLIAWELMSVLSYLIVNYEHLNDTNTRAGYVMLAAGEAGAVMIVLALLALAVHAGTGDFGALRSAQRPSSAFAWAVFLLSFFGFGVKAGLFPSMSWLPRAHPAAAANASALLSGVILNLGIYGIVRVNGDLLRVGAQWPGLIVLLVGSVSAILGILYATTENDLKRMLAHSSIENMGLIAVGIGAAFVFTAAQRPALAGIAYVAALYHLLNHSLYKSLLFLGAGAVDSAAGTRDLDRLGGLIRAMPWTSALFLAGALSIAALPPFNGFPSEWLTLHSLLRSVELSDLDTRVAFAVAGALVALTAGLALTAFVKAFGMCFLGLARSDGARNAREVAAGMRTGMALLAAGCLVLGVTPSYVVTALAPIASRLGGAGAADALTPSFFAPQALPVPFVAEFHALGAQIGRDVLPPPGLVLMHRGGAGNPVVFASAPAYLAIALLGLVLLVWLLSRLATRRRTRTSGRAWDGGLHRLLSRFTYTATGFSNPVRVIFEAVLAPRAPVQNEVIVARHFRTAINRKVEDTYALDRWLFAPLAAGAGRFAQALARMHHGRLSAYVAYAVVSIVLALVLASSW
ncbi:MAG TPA: proton-conducting transporter membrane subunit [Burkholderiaceae bacterium]|nr:proton-conducting transporter membrane subunit [Burkholderiaceae bacterium]